MLIFLAGPIDYWWNENWMTPEHMHYKAWRDLVSKKLVDAGYLVYRPHEAFKGAWDERAQRINDVAIGHADLVINLTPPGIPAKGTEAEITLAKLLRVRVVDAPPGDWSQIPQVEYLDDPYKDVPRKSK